MLNTKENRIKIYKCSISNYGGPLSILAYLDKMETLGKEYECKLIYEGIRQHYELEDKGVVLPPNYFKGIIDSIVSQVSIHKLMDTLRMDQLEKNMAEIENKIANLIN